jgi:isoleucyl-tRNA synthetase
MTLSIGDIELHTEDLLIETKQMEGYVSETDGTVTVALDTELTAELINEGFVNEVVSKLQTMRKETGFNVTDRITVWISGSEKVINAVSANKESVSKIVLADEIIIGDAANADSVKEWDINGETAVLSVKKN